MDNIEILLFLRDPELSIRGYSIRELCIRGFSQREFIFLKINGVWVSVDRQKSFNLNDLSTTKKNLTTNVKLKNDITLEMFVSNLKVNQDYCLKRIDDVTNEELESSLNIIKNCKKLGRKITPDVNSVDFQIVDYMMNVNYREEYVDSIERVNRDNKVKLSLLTRMSYFREEAYVYLKYKDKESGITIVQHRLVDVNNTAISCGVNQISGINQCLKIIYNLFSNIDDAILVYSKLFKFLERASQSSMIIYSTTRNDRNRYKMFFKEIENKYSSITRYSYNDNSSNEIGTTMLILRNTSNKQKQ